MKNWKRQLAMMLAIAMLASTTPLPVAQAWSGAQMAGVATLSDTSITVTFTAGEGEFTSETNSPSSIDKKYNLNADGAYKLKADDFPTNPTQTGFSFMGWFTNENDGATEIKVDTVLGSDSPTNYIAKWEAVTYDITYELGDVTTDNSNPTKAIHGESLTLADLSEDGHSFDGWYTESTFTNKVTSPYTVESAVTFYAKWTEVVPPPTTPDAETFTVTYTAGANGTIGTDKKTSYTKGERLELPTATPSTGYKLDKWTDEDDNTVTTSTTVTSNLALTANFVEDTSSTVTDFQVTFNYNYTGTTAHTTTGKKTVTSSNVTTYSVTPPSNPTRTGYTFAGWFKDSNGTGTAVDFSGTLDGITTYYAKWTTSHKVTLDLSDIIPVLMGDASTLTVAHGEAAKDPDLTYTNAGNNDKFYVRWYKESSYTNKWDFTTIIEKDTTIYGRWEDKDSKALETCEITYDYNEDLTEKKDYTYDMYKGIQSSGFGDINIIGFTFKGWYTDDDYETEAKFPYLIEEDVTFYAKFEADVENSVSGVVTDHEKDPVEKATVKLVQGSSTKYTTTTNSDGEYSFENVKEGIITWW